MALNATQGYKDFKREEIIYRTADVIIRLKNNMVLNKTEIENVYAEVNADANADPDLKTLASQANNFVNNVKITDFIAFVTNTLE